MKLMTSIKNFAQDLKALAKLERIIALVCISIPLLLRWAEHGSAFRDSISAYVNMSKNAHIFGAVFTLAGMLFIVNGVVYINNSAMLYGHKRHGRWYNIVLGLALLGVMLFPYDVYKTIHFTFAGIFFIGSAIVIALFHERRHRTISIIIAIISLSSLVVHFIDEDIISLLWAEWIALTVIGIHYILESYGIITYV